MDGWLYVTRPFFENKLRKYSSKKNVFNLQFKTKKYSERHYMASIFLWSKVGHENFGDLKVGPEQNHCPRNMIRKTV